MAYCADQSLLDCTFDHSEYRTLSFAAGGIIIRSVFHTKFVVWSVYLHTADRCAPGIVTRRSTGQTRLREWLVRDTMITLRNAIIIQTIIIQTIIIRIRPVNSHCRAAPLD